MRTANGQWQSNRRALFSSKTRVKSSLTRKQDANNTQNSPSLMSYERSWAWQTWLLEQRLHSKRLQRESSSSDTGSAGTIQSLPLSDQNTILLLELDHVYTLGRGADENNLTFLSSSSQHEPNGVAELRHRLARTNRNADSARVHIRDKHLLSRLLHQQHLTDAQAVQAIVDHTTKSSQHPPVTAPNGVPIFRVERGGQVTYHGPRQLVVYPLLDLQTTPTLQPDLHWFLHAMEQVIIQTLDELGIPGACRDPINTGVWVQQRKVAAVGVAASRWITTHGLALNVAPELDYFDTSVILPCGIEGRGVTSIAELIKEKHLLDSKACIPTVSQVADIVLKQMQDVLQLEMEAPEPLE